jgi:hypothetical protein
VNETTMTNAHREEMLWCPNYSGWVETHLVAHHLIHDMTVVYRDYFEMIGSKGYTTRFAVASSVFAHLSDSEELCSFFKKEWSEGLPHSVDSLSYDIGKRQIVRLRKIRQMMETLAYMDQRMREKTRSSSSSSSSELGQQRYSYTLEYYTHGVKDQFLDDYLERQATLQHYMPTLRIFELFTLDSMHYVWVYGAGVIGNVLYRIFRTIFYITLFFERLFTTVQQ